MQNICTFGSLLFSNKPTSRHMGLVLAHLVCPLLTSRFECRGNIPTKKFGQGSKVWVAFGEHYFRRKMLEDARKLLARSLQSLEKRNVSSSSLVALKGVDV